MKNPGRTLALLAALQFGALPAYAGWLINSFQFAVAATPAYVNTYEDTTSQTTYTFASASLGTPSASRMVVTVASCNSASGAISSITVDGTSSTSVVTSGSTSRHIEIWRAASTANSTGDIVITMPSSGTTGCRVSVYALYPSSQTPVDALGTNGTSVTTRTLTDLAKTAGGSAIFGCTTNDTTRTTTVTYTGETITKDNENTSFDAGKSVASHSVLNVASTTTLDDPVCTWSSSSAGVGFVGATWF